MVFWSQMDRKLACCAPLLSAPMSSSAQSLDSHFTGFLQQSRAVWVPAFLDVWSWVCHIRLHHKPCLPQWTGNTRGWLSAKQSFKRVTWYGMTGWLLYTLGLDMDMASEEGTINWYLKERKNKPRVGSLETGSRVRERRAGRVPG